MMLPQTALEVKALNSQYHLSKVTKNLKMTESCPGMGRLLLFSSALRFFTLAYGLSTPEKAFAPDSSTVHTDELSWHLAWRSCGRGIPGLWLNEAVLLMFLTWQ